MAYWDGFENVDELHLAIYCAYEEAFIKAYKGGGAEIRAMAEDAVDEDDAIIYVVEKVARSLLAKGFSPDLVARATNLSEKRVLAMKNTANKKNMSAVNKKDIKTMLKKGLDPVFVASITEFPVEQILAMR